MAHYEETEIGRVLIQDNPITTRVFREATIEERKAIADYIDSISVDTGFNLYNLQEQVKIYDAYYNKGFEDGIKYKEKKISNAKEQIFKWLIKREKEGYGTTLGECVDKVFELVSGK